MLSVHLANHFHFSKMVIEENFVLVFQMPVFRMNRILTTLLLAEISTMLQRKHRCGFIGASSTDVLTFSLPLNHRLTWRGGRQGLGFLECVSHLKGSIKTTPLILDELVPVSASDLKFGKGKGLSRGLWLFKLPY